MKKKAQITNEDMYFEVWDHLTWALGKYPEKKAIKETAKTFTISESDVEDVLDAINKLHESKKAMRKVAAELVKTIELEGTSVLKSSLRNKLNKKIHDLVNQTYFKEIPLGSIFKIMKENGVVALQEDGTEWSGLLLGKEGKLFIPLAPIDTDWGDPKEPQYNSYKNAAFYLTWYKMPSGNYEVVAYIS